MRALFLALICALCVEANAGPALGVAGRHSGRIPPPVASSAEEINITGSDLQVVGIRAAVPTKAYTSQASFKVSSWSRIEAELYDEAVILKVVNWPAALTGKTIQSATLTLYRSNGYTTETPSTPVMTLRQVLRTVDMAAATWTAYSAGNSWETAGAMGSLDVDASATAGTVTVDNTMGAKTVDTSANLVTLLQGWKDASIANNGMLIYPARLSDYHTFDGPTGTNPPVLTIVYTP